MSINTYSDAGNPIRRVRRAPHISTENEWIFHHQLQVDLETGLGPEPPLLQGGSYSATRVQCPGNPVGAQTYYFLTGVSTNARTYNFSVIVTNNTSSILTLGYGLNTGPGELTISVPPNSTYQLVEQSATGDGANDLILSFSTSMSNTPIDVTVYNPVIWDTVANTNLIPSSGLTFVTGWTIGVSSPTITQNQATYGSSPRDPEINLRWSDDGGHVWSNIHTIGAGQQGKYRTRCIWRRLGRSRDRVYEVSVSDPIPWRLLEADLLATPGFVPQERLSKTYQKVT
jgi:hypothetical protein